MISNEKEYFASCLRHEGNLYRKLEKEIDQARDLEEVQKLEQNLPDKLKGEAILLWNQIVEDTRRECVKLLRPFLADANMGVLDLHHGENGPELSRATTTYEESFRDLLDRLRLGFSYGSVVGTVAWAVSSILFPDEAYVVTLPVSVGLRWALPIRPYVSIAVEAHLLPVETWSAPRTALPTARRVCRTPRSSEFP